MKLLGSLDLNGMGGGGDGTDDVQGLLESMMSQLMSKDLLYDPLKELDDKVSLIRCGWLWRGGAELRTVLVMV